MKTTELDDVINDLKQHAKKSGLSEDEFLKRISVGYLVTGNSVWDLINGLTMDMELVSLPFPDMNELGSHIKSIIDDDMYDDVDVVETLDWLLGATDRVEARSMSIIEG